MTTQATSPPWVESPDFRAVAALFEARGKGPGNPLVFARASLAFRESFGVTAEHLATWLGVAQATIHHYESLARYLAPSLQEAMGAGLLMFKEARQLCDIRGKGPCTCGAGDRCGMHERQVALAGPFLRGERSSMAIERVVWLARRWPEASVPEVLRLVDLPDAYNAAPGEEPEKPGRRAVRRPAVDLDALERQAAHLAGMLAAIPGEPLAEIQRRKLGRTLAMLDGRLHPAIAAAASAPGIGGAVL